MGLWSNFLSDARGVVKRDPAVGGLLEAILCTPGLHALWAHRLAHPWYLRGYRLVPRLLSQWTRMLTGIEIHPGASIASGLFIDHGHGVVIGETAVIGQRVTIFQGVTLGGTGAASSLSKRHPTVGDDCVIGAGAVILGDLKIGQGSRVGAGSVVVRNVPANTTVIGVPARVVATDGRRTLGASLDHGILPFEVQYKLDLLQRTLNESGQEVSEAESYVI